MDAGLDSQDLLKLAEKISNVFEIQLNDVEMHLFENPSISDVLLSSDQTATETVFTPS